MTKLARKKATPPQSAKKLAIKLNKGLGWMKHQSRTVPLELHGTPVKSKIALLPQDLASFASTAIDVLEEKPDMITKDVKRMVDVTKVEL
ncbi:hypothetical protein TorRG33x02_143390 [Trema orientale]|uniref:Uncharacterized protein n=1 Tax=Trema orientale TaxID=63057 RepID=A0A2P5EW97_TREOI|nr:hypothetical protein TorRG33x02_143390 [Trema orientale]